MNPPLNDNGVSITPQNSVLTELQQLRKLVTDLQMQVANQPTNLQPINPTVATASFNDKYWFNSLQMVTVLNPAWYRPSGSSEAVTKDYEFMVEMRHFRVLSGATEKFPGVIANVYLDGMSKILAQNDDKLSFMADPAMKKIYYDRLIMEVENLAPEYNPVPAYLRNVAPTAVGPMPDDTPPWEANMERARDVAPNPIIPEPETVVVKQPIAPEPGEKGFEYNGIKFEAKTNTEGLTTFFKAGKLIDEAVYAKAASML